MSQQKSPHLQQIVAFFVNLSFLFQNLLAPFVFLTYAQPVQAVSSQPTTVEVSFDRTSHSFDVVAKAIQAADVTLSYQHPANQELEGLVGNLQADSAGIGQAQYFAGTKSGDQVIEHAVSQGDLNLVGTSSAGTSFNLTSHFVMKNGILWVEESSDSYTTYSVELGQTYNAPQDEKVAVTFLTLPENPGSLHIQKLKLSVEKQAELGAVSEVAYNITSDMPDGSFSYDLTLPNPAPDKEVTVQYSEDGEVFTDIEGETQNNGLISIKNLNHFTIFVVTTVSSVTSLSAPTNLGYNQNDGPGDSFALPHPATEISCGGFTSKNSISHHWTDVSDDSLVKYQRQYQVPGSSSWSGNEIYADPYSNFRVFGSSAGNQGTYNSQVRAFHDANNNNVLDASELTSSWSSNNCQITFDNQAPEKPTLAAPQNGALVSGNPGQSWNPVAGVHHYKYESFSDVGLQNKIYSETTTQTSRTVGGTQTITFWWHVQAVDAAGNASPWSDAWKLTIDNTKPTIALTNPVAGRVKGTIDIRGTVQDANPHHYWVAAYKKNGPSVFDKVQNHSTSFTNQTIYTWDTTQVEDGDYIIKFAERDAADNRTNDVVVEVTVDNHGPTAPTISFPVNGQYFQTAPILNQWTAASDPAGIKEYRIKYVYDDNHSFSGGPYRIVNGTSRQHSPTQGEQGGVTIRVQAFDTLGNEGEWSQPIKYYYDSVAPASPTNLHFLDAQGKNLGCGSFTNQLRATVDWDNVSDAVKYEYTINYPFANGSGRGQWTIFVTNSQYGGSLNQGEHIVKVRAIDAAGNASAWTNTCNLTADSIVPDVPTLSSPEDGFVTQGVAFDQTWIPVAGAHHYNYRSCLNDPTAEPCQEKYTDSYFQALKSVAAGQPDSHFWWQVQSVDAANNISEWSEAWELIIDNTKPNSVITAPYESSSSATLITNDWDGSLAGTASDSASPVSQVLLSIQRESDGQYWDGSAWVTDLETEVLFAANGTTNWNYALSNPDPDNYTIRSHAVDAAGNQENTAQLRIIYDRTIPEVTLTTSPASPDGQDGWFITEPIVTLTATDTNGVSEIQYQWGNDANWLTYTQPLPIPGQGSHLLTYRAIDQAGNISQPGLKTLLYDKNTLTHGVLNLSVSPNPTNQKEVTVK